MTPAQPGEAGVSAVGGDEFGTAFHSQGCQVGVGDEVAFGPHRPAEAREDFPMTLTRPQGNTVRPVAESVREFQRFGQLRWWIENLWVCDDAQEARKSKFRHAKSLIGTDRIQQPTAIEGVPGRRLPEGVHQDVNVYQDHGCRP